MTDKIYKIIEPSNPWARISDIAAKVGVRPCEGIPPQPTFKAKGVDGKEYDVLEIVIAVLDRIEKVLDK